MFGLFANKKSKLEAKYAKLLEEAHRLSHSSRIQSDLKTAEAEEVLKAIKELEASEAK
ncbi:hypothetical protein CA54_20790 [Symmachiella macrocystis]|uniref:Lacal_2735 family protein n=1 Tax=Symmachiella macrocystis TaxID=2527985 RepID=A0A5C6BPU6_9PLAN|nr:Lacal_2735 family protein [Symmachiella macrocystis]TWU13246.1 hypothetical protein CA54_20790 [Symmachiella macrocystis]